MRSLIIIGAGGHGKVIADTVLQENIYEDIAFLDDNFNEVNQNNILMWKIIGKTKDFKEKFILDRFKSAFVAIGNAEIRLNLINLLKKEGYHIPIIKHPSSYVSKFSKVGEGTVFLANSTLQANSTIGKGCILNTCSNVDHDSKISEGVHICPGASIAGNVSIGKNSWIGIGSSIKENIKIGSEVLVGAGAVVTKDLPNCVKAKGVPARWELVKTSEIS